MQFNQLLFIVWSNTGMLTPKIGPMWGGGAIIILFRKFVIAQEPNVQLTSNQAVNSSLYAK